MLQNARVTAFTVSQLLGESNRGGDIGKKMRYLVKKLSKHFHESAMRIMTCSYLILFTWQQTSGHDISKCVVAITIK